jgi:hypothetical protein
MTWTPRARSYFPVVLTTLPWFTQTTMQTKEGSHCCEYGLQKVPESRALPAIASCLRLVLLHGPFSHQLRVRATHN